MSTPPIDTSIYYPLSENIGLNTKKDQPTPEIIQEIFFGNKDINNPPPPLPERGKKFTIAERKNEILPPPLPPRKSSLKTDGSIERSTAAINFPKQATKRRTFQNSISPPQYDDVLDGLGEVEIPASKNGMAQNFIELFSKDLEWENLKFALSIKSTFSCSCLKQYQVNTELGKLVNDLIKFAPKNCHEEIANPVKTHEKLLTELREILESHQYKAELQKKIEKQKNYDHAVDTLLELCRRCFKEGYFYDDFHKKLMKEMGLKDNQGFSKDDFDTIISSKFYKENRLPIVEVNAKKFSGYSGIAFDASLYGNIPNVFGALNIGGKLRDLLRMPTPTIQGFGTAIINQEFRGFIQYCTLASPDDTQKGLSHLYISLQNEKDNEAWRNLPIKNLQQDFPKNFFVVILTQDSKFYRQVNQHGEPLGSDLPIVFLKEFKRQLFGKDTGFYFRDEWKKDKVFRHNVKKLLNLVHIYCFNSKALLTHEEKLDFIEVAYGFLILYFIHYCNADSANVTCKDAIDRAGKVNANLIKIYLTIIGLIDTPESQQFHRASIHIPPFLAKSQPVVKSRRDRLITSDMVLNNAKKKLMGLKIPIWEADPANFGAYKESGVLLIDPQKIDPKNFWMA